MCRNLGPLRLFVAAFVVLTLAARVVAAAPNDAAASKLREDAIFQDYLATNFADAQKKLAQALALCVQANDCVAATRARLHCDLGVIDFALQRPEDGRAEFAAALHEDPKITVDHNLSTPELEQEFATAKGVKPPPKDEEPPPAPTPPGPASTAPAPSPTSTGSTTPARDGSDCPPGFPGCDATNKRDCTSDDDCASRETCRDSTCQENKEAAPVDLPFERNWFSLGFQVEALLLPSAQNACAGGTGYSCFDDGGGYYRQVPLAGADDVVNGGIGIGTMRVLLGYDRVLGENFSVGGRLGFAFGGGPQRPGSHAFEPVHVEARGSYWFGHDPFGRKGFRFFVEASAGMAEVDASVPVDIYSSLADYNAGNSKNFNAWKKTGLGFAALGPGAMFALTPNSGIVLEAKAMEMFPTTGTVVALELGYTMGLF
jgi:hypothetical protein